MFSNRYIFIYATILIVVISALLSTTAKFLQPFQMRNIRIEKIQDILSSAGIVSKRSTAETLFEKHIVEQLLIDRHGNLVNDGRIAFEVNLRDELRRLRDLEAGRSTVEPVFPLFVSEYNNQTLYVVPLFGSGLWGPLWGYAALYNDFSTIAGVVFDHQGETPGLGSQVADRSFQNQFKGKKIFDNQDRFRSVVLVKGGVANSSIPNEHGVDAITGGTITGDGLSDMLRVSLENYVTFFRKQRAEAQRQQEQEENLTEENN
jgi:Na+-transporting NADH:ubiquinone oxidoreductase subunit C